MTEINSSQSSNPLFKQSSLDFIPLPITENIAGNYDKYLRISLFHIHQLKKYFLNTNPKSDELREKYFGKIFEKNISRDKKILLLDLDETLIHADFLEDSIDNEIINENQNNKYDTIISFYTEEPSNNNNHTNDNNNNDTNTTDDESKDDSSEKVLNKVGIFIRPKVKEFLEEISKLFEIGIFTASIPEYADAVINYLDPDERYIKFRLYRNDCVIIGDLLRVKDLSIFGEENLNRIVLLDNNIYSFPKQLSNGILVNSFFCDKKDDELSNVRKYLIEYIFPCDDVRKINEQFFGFKTILENFTKINA